MLAVLAMNGLFGRTLNWIATLCFFVLTLCASYTHSKLGDGMTIPPLVVGAMALARLCLPSRKVVSKKAD
jgi:hypothetical protein